MAIGHIPGSIYYSQVVTSKNPLPLRTTLLDPSLCIFSEVTPTPENKVEHLTSIKPVNMLRSSGHNRLVHGLDN